MPDLLAIILAAGEGTRMKSARPKVLHEVGGLPMLAHVARAVSAAGASSIVVVTAGGDAAIRDAVAPSAPEAEFYVQAERRGTADAVRAARGAWERASGNVVVVYADHPLIVARHVTAVADLIAAGADVATLAFEPADPTGYGRLIVEGEQLRAIREQKDATDAERQISLCNSCVMGFRAEILRDLIGKISDDNAQSEFYLTDMIGLANRAGLTVRFAVADDPDEVMGVSDRTQLAAAEAVFQRRKRAQAMQAGVTLTDPQTVWFSHDTEIEPDVEIGPSVRFGPGVSIETGARIRAFCHLEGARVGPGAVVGPYARLRPGAEIAEGAHIGDFVEVKNATVGKGSKANHLAYIGDATLGENVNFGAGAITCNYDGAQKHRTVIGDGVFVGSNSALVAPVRIGEGAYIASGSVITEDVEPDALAFGRARQSVKPGRAAEMRARLAKSEAKSTTLPKGKR